MYTLDFSGAKIPVQEELVLVVENRLLTMVDAGVDVVVVVESICVWDLEEQDEDGCSGGGGGGCDLVVGPRAMTDEFALKQFCVYSSRIRHVTLGAECFKGNIALEKFQLPRCLPGGSFRAGRRVFGGCTGLTDVRLGCADSDCSLDVADLFAGCTALERLLLLGDGFSPVAMGGGGGIKAVYLCDQYLDAVDMSLLDAGEFTAQIADWKRKYHELQEIHKTHSLNPPPRASPHAPKHPRKKRSEKKEEKKREKKREKKHHHRRRRQHHHQRREIARRSESTPSIWDKMLKALLQKWLPMK